MNAYTLTHTIERYGPGTAVESYASYTDLWRRTFALGVIRFAQPNDLSSGGVYDGRKCVAKFEQVMR